MIRKYQDKDLDEVMHCWLKTNIEAHDFIAKEYWINHYEFVKSLIPQTEVFVFEELGTIQGFIGIEKNYIAGLFVKSSAQSLGIGTALLNYVKTDKNRLSLSVYVKNEAAVRFYKKAGFEIDAEQIEVNTHEHEFLMSWEH